MSAVKILDKTKTSLRLISHTYYRDVCLVTPEVGKFDSWNSDVARHLERSTVLHNELDDSVGGVDVSHTATVLL